MVGVCHCKNCQRQAGSAFSIFAGVPRAAFDITGDALKTYEDTADSGNKIKRLFCGECGSPIYSDLSPESETVYLKVGTLDDTSELKPQFHVWCDSAQDWVEIPEGIPVMPKQS
jgi:hypothetical protein